MSENRSQSFLNSINFQISYGNLLRLLNHYWTNFYGAVFTYLIIRCLLVNKTIYCGLNDRHWLLVMQLSGFFSTHPFR